MTSILIILKIVKLRAFTSVIARKYKDSNDLSKPLRQTSYHLSETKIRSFVVKNQDMFVNADVNGVVDCLNRNLWNSQNGGGFNLVSCRPCRGLR